jgi:hypothetical protein
MESFGTKTAAKAHWLFRVVKIDYVISVNFTLQDEEDA